MAAKKGLNLLAFKSSEVTISRGTYTKNAVCITPPSTQTAFSAAVAANPTNAAFKMSPASISVAMGAKEGCAALGTASTTQMSTHNVYWTVTNGTDQYT